MRRIFIFLIINIVAFHSYTSTGCNNIELGDRSSEIVLSSLPIESNFLSHTVQIEQSNPREPNTKDPEFNQLLSDVKQELVFNLVTQNNIPYEVLNYDPNTSILTVPKEISSDNRIHVSVRSNKYFIVDQILDIKKPTVNVEVIRHPIEFSFFNPDGARIQIDEFSLEVYHQKSFSLIATVENNSVIPELYRHPLISYRIIFYHSIVDSETTIKVGYDDFKQPVKVEVNEKANYYTFKFEHYTNYINPYLPEDVSIKVYWKDLPFQFELTENLKQHWIIASPSKLTSFTEELKGPKEVRIKLKRITQRQDFIVHQTGLFPETFYASTNTFVSTEAKRRKLIKNKNIDFTLTAEFPENPLPGDKVEIIIRKTFGINIIEPGVSKHDSWKSDSIIITYEDQDRKKEIIWDSIPPYHVFYIDLSHTKERIGIQNYLTDKLSALEFENVPYLVYISNGNNPLIYEEFDDHDVIINSTYELIPTAPDLRKDKSRISELLPTRRCPLIIHYYVSPYLYQYSFDQILNDLLIDSYGLIQQNLNSVEEILDFLGDKVWINVCLTEKHYSESNSINHSHFKKVKLTN